MMTMVNVKVHTPLGEGIVQGAYPLSQAPLSRSTETFPQMEEHNLGEEERMICVLVRLPINEVTRVVMAQSNCLTPRAKISGLWVFGEGELL